MNDMTFDPNLDLGNFDVDRAAASLRVQQRAVVNDGLEQNPDDAAEAMELSDITGAPAAHVAANLDEYKAEVRRQAAHELVLNNPDLVAYVQGHPLAAAVSNDDWGNLDKFTRGSSSSWLKGLANATNPTPKVVSDFVDSVLQGGVQGVMQGLATGAPMDEATHKFVDPDQQGRLRAAVNKSLYDSVDVVTRLGNALMGGISGAVGGGGEALGLSKVEQEALLNNQMAESGMHMHAPEAEVSKPQTAMDVARPYLTAGEEPPAGLHPEIDAHKAALNEEFLTKLEEDLSNAVASTTRERAPELFAKLTERMYGESTISLHADAALGLYGDKLPAADDKLLGWVPNIDTQLAAARDIGSDVQIPLKHWMAQVDPEVAKAVRDDIRVWPGGVTANEAKELPTEPKAIINEALPSVRAGAGLEPKFSIGDRKLSLGLFDKTADEDLTGKPYEMHDYDINDENGTAVGKIRLVPGADGKTLYVDYIGGKAGLWANSFGPALVRDLKAQLKGLYPDYEYLTGHRVTGARVGLAAAGEETPMPLPRVRLAVDPTDTFAEYSKALDVFHNGWERASEGSSLLVNRQGPEFYNKHQMAFGQATADEITKLTGGRAEPQGVAGITDGNFSRVIRGSYTPQYDSAPKIFYDLLGPDPKGIGRHESIHMLRDYGMFKPEEWSALEQAAHTEGWLDRYGINERYPHLDDGAKTEEAIAEAFREWAAQAEDVRPKTGVGALFQKIWDFLDRIRQGMGKYLGREPTWDEVFQRTASGEVGQRTPGVPGQEGQFRFSVEDERKANIEGMTNLQAASIGMDAQSFRKIQDAIRKQGEEDLRKATALAEREETKRQTREWKQNRSEMAKEVAPEIRQRPDVAADLFVGSGELYGQKLKQRIPLAEDRLTPEQKAALPDHYYAKSGVDPDRVAGLFGLQSGDELVASLARTEALKNVGGKRMRAEDFIRKIISDETDRRMEMRYGDLQANILDAAKDSALSKSSLNVMHEELMAVAQKAGVTVFDRATIDKAAQGLINEFPLGKINSFRVMQELGRHARNAEKAIAKGDWAEAAVHMQKQTVAAHVAAEAKRLEGEIAKFDKVAKRWAKRDQPSVPVEFGNWVHDILQRIGKPVRMTPKDLQRQIRGESATAQTFEEFVREQSEMGSAIDAWEGLMDPKWNKPYKTLTAEEFRGVRDTVQTLIETGRLTKKIVAQGVEFDREEVIGQLIDKVRELPFKSVDAQGKESIVTRMPKGYLTRALQAETIFGHWDGFDPWGVWTQKVFRDLKDADNQADAWRKEYSKRLSALEDGVDLNKAIANKVFKAPEQYGGGFVSMNRGSLRSVMLNLGSESNIAKLTKGWQVDEKAVRAFVDAHAKPEDWKFVQGVWDIFGELKEKSDTMYRSMGRMASKTIEAQPVETPHGTFRGGYYPVMFHEVYAKVPKVESASGLLDPSYESLTPNAGYTVARKNFFQPLTMGLDRLPGRLNQIIHDTAMRPSVENFGKVMYDGRVKAAIQTHAGIDVYDNMVNYIKGVANKANTGVQLWKDGAAVSSFMRQNIMAGLVGFNPGTILKHGFTAAGLSMKEVGLPRFFNAVRSLHSVDKATGESNYQFAMQHSLELQRRDRNFDESLHGAVGNLSPVQDTRVAGKNLGPAVEKFLDYRQRLIEMSGKPLAFSDKLSSVPTWLAAYDKHIEEGMTHGDAVFAADRAVRRAHGSTSITSRPTLMNELNPWLTTFYNFFNDVFNRQTETLWRAGEAADLAKKGQWDKARGVAGTVAAGVFAYSIWPALVENWVTPQENDPKDGWVKRAAKGMAFTEGATLPVVRDFTSMLLEGKNPDVGLFSTAYEHGTDLIRDLDKKQPLAPAHTQGLIRASSELLALFTGAPEQFGKLASGAYGLAAGTEHPRGPWAWGALGRYGTLKGHSQTAGQYLAGQYERRR